jgi:hypothetical protein
MRSVLARGQSSRRQPPPHGLVAFLLRHFAAGVLAAVVFEAVLLAQDYASLRTMAASSPDGPLYLTLLFFGLVVTLGGVAMAVGVMRARPHDD